MNICKRILLLFLLCVVLFAQYSPLHTVYATGVDTGLLLEDDYGVSTLDLDDEDISNGLVKVTSAMVYYDNNGEHFLSSIHSNTSDTFTNTGYTSSTLPTSGLTGQFFQQIEITSANNFVIFPKGKTFNIELTNIVNKISVAKSGSIAVNYSAKAQPSSAIAFLIDSNNGWHSVPVDVSQFRVSDGKINFNISYDNQKCDAYKIFVRLIYSAYDFYPGMPSGVLNNSNYEIKFFHGFDNSVFKFEVDDGTKGLLQSIIQLVTNIKDGVADLPGKIASSIKGFFDNVVNAVVNLGTTILEGIKGLFVPSEEDITEMKDKWEQLLADRFGALYQVTELIADYVEVFQANEQGTITFPTVTIPLGEADFVFGGWDVQIVPQGFDVLFTALKSIISIVCTVWCVNGLKNRFERIVGGSSNI